MKVTNIDSSPANLRAVAHKVRLGAATGQDLVLAADLLDSCAAAHELHAEALAASDLDCAAWRAEAMRLRAASNAR